MTLLIRLLLVLMSIPGVVVHELGHQLLCHLTGTRVREVRYFRFSIPPGYVIHDRPASAWRHSLIALGPFLVNSAAAFALGLCAARGLLPGTPAPWARILWTWLAVAIGMHAFPSIEDANGLMDSLWSPGGGCLPRLVLTPLGALMYLGAFGSWVFLDLAYGIGVAWVLPWHLTQRAGIGGALRLLT